MIRLSLKQQKQLQLFMEFYNSLDRIIVSDYLRHHIKQSGVKSAFVANNVNVSVHTINAILKLTGANYKPEFIIFLRISNYLKLSFNDLLTYVNLKKEDRTLTDREIINLILDNCGNNTIREFCGLSQEEYLKGINSDNNDYLVDAITDTIQRMPLAELNKFINSIG